MNIEFESLKLLPQIFELIQRLNANLQNAYVKRWLSVKELSTYLTFGKDKIYKMIDVEFIESEHYFRKGSRLLFDKEKIDAWVRDASAPKLSITDKNKIIDNILSCTMK